MNMAETQTVFSGRVHRYSPRNQNLIAFEIGPDNAPNTLLFIGGLCNGLLDPPYTTTLAACMPPRWSFAQVLLTSAYTGWGSASLQGDAAEMAEAVTYFRSQPGKQSGKVVLMGHSTGCQDVMEYLVGTGAVDRPMVDGGILQAPVSDRECVADALDPTQLQRSLELAREMVADGRGEDMLPRAVTNNIFGAYCSARRWISLVAMGGDDDYFSSDLSDERLAETFGRVPRKSPLCILIGEKDEFVPQYIDKEALTKKWVGFAMSGNGGVNSLESKPLLGATHSLKDCTEDVVHGLIGRVKAYLEGVE